ncbi:hypothetical protein Tco_0906797 [Tanacetum coccineum]|uniref:Uncharacterized protein n=1 Tax=Tanacetum coccineum TaxID=301880 RepID=A0ABQ5CK94_9ASTR
MVNRERQLQALVDKKKIVITESTIRRDLHPEDAGGTDCLPTSTIFEKLTRMRRKQRKGTEIPSSSGEPITDEAANEEHIPTHSNDPLLSGEDRLQLNELMYLCTNLQKKVLKLKEVKIAQAKEIASLKKRFKKSENKRKSRTLGLKRVRNVGSARRVVSSDEASFGVNIDNNPNVDTM